MIELSQQKRSYTKVPPDIKKVLIKNVFQDGMKIKQAAKQLEMKYATAKTIILLYRKKVVRKKLIFLSNKPCLILPLDNKKRNIKIVSLVAGKLQNSE